MLIKEGESFFIQARAAVSAEIATWTASGQPLSNLATLQAQAQAAITTDAYNKWNNYKTACQTGSVYKAFKGYLMSMFSFASLKYCMETKSGPAVSGADPTVTTSISWEYYDMGLPSAFAPWFTYNVVGDTPPAEGTIVISPNLATWGANIETRSNIDILGFETFQTTTGAAGADKTIYLTFANPPIKPSEKPAAEIVKIDWGVKDFAISMGWNIPGVTD